MIFVSPNPAQHFAPLNDSVILNFASGTRPGGGWRNHKLSQEESLCSVSNLGSLLETAHTNGHRFWSGKAPFYTDCILDVEALFFNSYLVNVLSMAQVNASKGLTDELLDKAHDKIRILLDYCFEDYNGRPLVFGPWGCGVFKLPPIVMAGFWKKLLQDYNFTNDIIFACGVKDDTFQVFSKMLL